MFRRLIRATTVAACVTVTAVGLSTAARAAPPPHEWITAPCVTGAVTGTSPTAGGDVVVNGEAASCGGTPANAQAALVLFFPNDLSVFVHRRDMWYLGSQASSGSVRLPQDPGAFGVCVMASYSRRIACAEGVTAADGTVTLRPVETSDPLVSHYVERTVMEAEDEQVPGNPECASCV